MRPDELERRLRRHTFATGSLNTPKRRRKAYDLPERAEGDEAATPRIIQRGLLARAPGRCPRGPGVASAAANPSGTGQPSRSCLSQSAAAEPGRSASARGSAFNKNGGIAGGVYAGSPGTPSAANGSSNAVSQYDVACYR
jgi:hypothetical protein